DLLGKDDCITFALFPEVRALEHWREEPPQPFQLFAGQLIHCGAVVELVGEKNEVLDRRAGGNGDPQNHRNRAVVENPGQDVDRRRATAQPERSLAQFNGEGWIGKEQVFRALARKLQPTRVLSEESESRLEGNLVRDVEDAVAEDECPPENQRIHHLTAKVGANVPELRGKRELQRLAYKVTPRASAGTLSKPDDPVHCLHVPEPPELKSLLDVDELLAHLVFVPEALGVLVDSPENHHHRFAALVRLPPVPFG